MKQASGGKKRWVRPVVEQVVLEPDSTVLLACVASTNSGADVQICTLPGNCPG